MDGTWCMKCRSTVQCVIHVSILWNWINYGGKLLCKNGNIYQITDVIPWCRQHNFSRNAGCQLLCGSDSHHTTPFFQLLHDTGQLPSLQICCLVLERWNFHKVAGLVEVLHCPVMLSFCLKWHSVCQTFWLTLTTNHHQLLLLVYVWQTSTTRNWIHPLYTANTTMDHMHDTRIVPNTSIRELIVSYGENRPYLSIPQCMRYYILL